MSDHVEEPPVEEIDLEPVIRRIVQEENASVNTRLDEMNAKIDALNLGELGDSIKSELGDLFKKNKNNSSGPKLDEDTIVDKLFDKLKGTSTGGDGGGSKRAPGPLSRMLGIK